MRTSSAYKQFVNWQKSQGINFGDKVRFLYKGRCKMGYLTGFDMEGSPLKLIVRYVNKLGFLQVVSIEMDAIIAKN